MIKNITVTRAGVSTSISDPVQWSENSQLAVNNGFQITLFDPKLPNIHNSIVSRTVYRPREVQKSSDSAPEANGDDQNAATAEPKEKPEVDDSEQWKSIGETNMLNTKEMFDQSTILHTEVLVQMDVCKFNKVIVNSNNNDFWFARISEPTIVKHQWSGISITTKDCYLGVLLNTGELLIFERGSKQAQDYKLKHNSFDLILRQLEIEDSSEVNVDYHQFLKLKVKDFNFHRVGDRQLVTILNGASQIVVYDPDFQLETIVDLSYSVINYAITFQRNEFLVGFVTTENEVLVHSSASGDGHRLVAPNRFKVSKIKWYKDYLIFCNTVKLFIYNVNSGLVSVDLDVVANVSAVTVVEDVIVVSTEIGSFRGYDLNGEPRDSATVQSLSKFASTTLMKYQLANDFNNEEITKNYLNLIDGNMLTFGCNANANGIISTVFKLYPKNNVNYTILSKDEFNIAFENTKNSNNSNPAQTSLSFINKLWFQKFVSLLVFPKNLQIASTNFIAKFIEGLKDFKTNTFGGQLREINSDSSNINESFSSYLIANFTMNRQIITYQRLFNFDEIVIRSNNTLVTKLKTSQESDPLIQRLLDLTEELKKEQITIRELIMKYLIRLVFEYVIQLNSQMLQEIDEFLLLGYKSFQPSKPEFSLTEKTIEFGTDYFTERFHLSPTTTFTELLVSESNHSWPRCGLTLFPLLDFNTKTDELNKFHYTIPNVSFSPQSLTYQLLSTLDYCIFTGNKLYRAQ